LASRTTLLRSALLPASPDVHPAECVSALDTYGDALRSLIVAEGLGPLWHVRTGDDGFRETHRAAAREYLVQRAALLEVDELFERAGIPWAAFKGAATRELVYDLPTTRPALDIDVLVAPADRVTAARLLSAAGYGLSVTPASASHEVTLSSGPRFIDLHWHVMRPGRTRVALTQALLAGRRRERGVWVLGDADAMFLLLVHPAFTEHVSASQAGRRACDLIRWLHVRPVDWAPVCRRLEESGVRTAAWAVLRWLRAVAQPGVAALIDPAIAELEPGRLRAAYLAGWVEHDLPRRLARLHAARLLGFSLLLHDTPADALRAVHSLGVSRRQRRQDTAAFDGIAGVAER
jgi:hypothetical protein